MSGDGADADDNQSVSSVTRRVKGMVKKIFVFKKLTTGSKSSPTSSSAAASSATPADPEAPMKEIHTASLLLSPSADSAESTEPQVLPPTPEKDAAAAVEEEEAKEEEEKKDLPLDEAVVYKDDNDGTKDGCFASCEGCIIL